MQLTTQKKLYVGVLAMVLIAFFVLWFQVPFSHAATLQDKINEGSNKIVQFFKDILKGIALIMFGSMGYSYLFSKTAEGLADMKGRILIILACFILILGGDWIYETINGFFS